MGVVYAPRGVKAHIRVPGCIGAVSGERADGSNRAGARLGSAVGRHEQMRSRRTTVSVLRFKEREE